MKMVVILSVAKAIASTTTILYLQILVKFRGYLQF